MILEIKKQRADTLKPGDVIVISKGPPLEIKSLSIPFKSWDNKLYITLTFIGGTDAVVPASKKYQIIPFKGIERDPSKKKPIYQWVRRDSFKPTIDFDFIKKTKEKLRPSFTSKVDLSNFKKITERSITFSSNLGSAFLGTAQSVSLDRWMRSIYDGPATKFDKAMDYTYNTLKQHGGDHRLFDGGHSPVDAWKAISKHVPDVEGIAKVEGYIKALWKDMATPKGIPIVTWDKNSFDSVAEFLQKNVGISKTWTKDIVSFTSTELIGATLGGLSIFLQWNQEDLSLMSETVGSLGLSAVAGANPLLVIVCIIGVARCYQKTRKENRRQVLVGSGKGIVTSAAVLAVGTLSTPVWSTLALSVCSFFLARYLYEKTIKIKPSTYKQKSKPLELITYSYSITKPLPVK